MIRRFENNDLHNVMQIWYETNVKAHSFISKEYWLSQYGIVKLLLPQAEVYVYEDDITKQINGFIGLSDHLIEGLFVKETAQSHGIGKQLLDYAKSIRQSLSLAVYQKNVRAILFYKREQFEIESERIDENTNENEFIMTWRK